jgi:hypothetical protein
MLEEAPDATGDVALEAASDLAVGAALAASSFDVVKGGLVVAYSRERDDVER